MLYRTTTVGQFERREPAGPARRTGRRPEAEAAARDIVSHQGGVLAGRREGVVTGCDGVRTYRQCRDRSETWPCLDLLGLVLSQPPAWRCTSNRRSRRWRLRDNNNVIVASSGRVTDPTIGTVDDHLSTSGAPRQVPLSRTPRAPHGCLDLPELALRPLERVFV